MTHPSLIKYYNNDLDKTGNRIALPFIWNLLLVGIAGYAVVQFIF